MDFHRLRVFRAAANSKSFTKASEDLHLSQSTVSLHIQQLEQDLGCPLFLRVGRRVVLSEAGYLLLEYSERIFRDIKNAEMAVREFSALRRGSIRLGSGATTLIYRLPKTLSEYHNRFPDIELIIATGTTDFLIQEIKSERLDLSVIMLPVTEAGFRVTSLGSEEMVIVVPDEFLPGKTTVSPADLQTLPFILFPKQTAMQNLIDCHLAALGVVPRITMELEDIESVKSLVSAGLGASIFPLCALDSGTRRRGLRAVRIADAPLYRNIGLMSLETAILPRPIRELATLIERDLGRQTAYRRKRLVSLK
jgi:DNA-binding transcriptional LysR family regulator